MAVALQWSLDQTTNSALSIAKGVLLAATNDNVQPLAIEACERFGNTLAMCQEVCKKVEMLVTRTSMPIVIQWLQVSAGFSNQGAAMQFCRTQAGVQFLGLSAALLSSMEVQVASSALDLMITSSASDKTLLPTSRQIKDLLTVLEPQLQHSGFLDSVVGWDVYFRSQRRILLSSVMMHPFATHSGIGYFPNGPALQSIVEAFRQISRIGDPTVSKVHIELLTCLSWTVAFTKWCLGVPPIVYGPNGTVYLDQPDSKVEILVNPSSATSISVSIHRTVGGPIDLVESYSRSEWTGMLSIESYGQMKLTQRIREPESYRMALIEAFPFAIQRALQALKFGAVSVLSSGDEVDEKSFDQLRTSPFESENAVLDMACRYLGVSEMKSTVLLEDFDLKDLPHVRSYSKAIQLTCSCTKCSRQRDERPLIVGVSDCLGDGIFFKDLASMVADVLSLSIFENPENLWVNMTRSRYEDDDFSRAISSTLSLKSSIRVRIPHLLKHTFSLVGHGSPGEDLVAAGWVISAFKGQVIYPAIYETSRYTRQGFLALVHIPGIIRYDRDVYNFIGSRDLSQSIPGLYSEVSVIRPLNLYPNSELVWKIQKNEDKLKGLMILSGSSYGLISPHRILRNLASALIMDACSHSSSDVLDSPDDSCCFAAPPWSSMVSGKIKVIPVDGSNGLRLSFLACSNEPAVLRKKACLSCCLDVCKKTGRKLLIL